MKVSIESHSPRQKSLNRKLQFAISLPSINRPQREQIQSFFFEDKAKTKKKFQENSLSKDISHLKDTYNENISQDLSQKELPLTFTDILKQAYPECELDNQLMHIMNPRTYIIKESAPKVSLEGVINTADIPPVLVVPVPTGRQEVYNLKSWLDEAESKYGNLCTNLIKTNDKVDKSILFKAWQGIYKIAFKEIIRQVTVQCFERGILLQKILAGYEKVNSYYNTKTDNESININQKEDDKMNEALKIYSKQISQQQIHIERLEREKEKWFHDKAQILIKTIELIKHMEKLKKCEDQLKGVKGKSNYFESYAIFIDTIAKETDFEIHHSSVLDSLKEKIDEKIKKIAELKIKIKEMLRTIKELNEEINEKEYYMSSLSSKSKNRKEAIKLREE